MPFEISAFRRNFRIFCSNYGIIMIYIHKFLPILVSPLGLVIFLLIAGVVLKRYGIVVSAIILLLVSSLPLTGYAIWYALEFADPPKKYEEIGYHQGVVILSSGVETLEMDGSVFVEWGDPDRFFAGLHVIKLKKADHVIFTRGKMPWSNSMPEGETLKKAAIDLGIPPEKIILTKIVSNTAEEAIAVEAVLQSEGIKSILLVTSSFHMPRAELLFRRQGIDLETFPVDFQALGHRVNWLHFFPSASGFNKTSKGLREFIGRAYYKFKFAS